ncbi:MAG TPA: MerR family transcriptional regulator [Candidatus Limnocylindria bacterium]|nr:MerR family transcriptional regulator [Candidatus Limnocylindria bacterium]
MRIGTLAQQLGTTVHAVRFYERHGLVPAPERAENGYREYTERDAERLGLLIGLRRLGLSLDQSALLAASCSEGRCAEVSDELQSLIASKRTELKHRLRELSHLDRRLAHLEARLHAGAAPRPLIDLGKEEHRHDRSLR